MLQDGSAPDVWLQLLERCAADPTCQPAALHSLAQQLSEQRALTGQHEQRLWIQERHMVAQHQQIGNLHWQLQELHAAVQQLLPAHRRPLHQY
jgi:hypothetical protein